MERNLLKYVWKHSRPDQLWMLVIILASMPTYFLSLELPKRIVNDPIQGNGFENPGDTGQFLQFYMPFGESLFGQPVMLFEGFELERVGFLLALSFSFLALVMANGLFKLYINTYKGRMGERILRRLRYELFDRVMRYPLSRFRRTKPSEIASMIKDEVEPMGEFIGDAFTQPLFLGGQALVALLFIMLQNFWLGIVTLIVVLFQAWLIPILRRRLIELGKQRQIAARRLAGRLGEIVEGIQEAHTNDTTNLERAEMSSILGRLFFIRFELFQRKFSVKFINNLLIQFLAFFFYAVGGYLAITGRLDIGQLIGVIVAYKDLPAPVRGLIDHDQKRLTVEVRYGQIIEQFTADELKDAALQKTPEGKVSAISKGYEVSKLGVVDDTGSKLLENVSADIGVNERVAIVGNFSSGADVFVSVLGNVIPSTSGRVLLDDIQIETQPEHVTGRRLSYIDGSTFFPQGTILEILTYVLKNQPVREAERDAEEQKKYAFEKVEQKRSANYHLDFDADWIDYERLGLGDQEELTERIREVLTEVDMESDVRALGLRGTLDPEVYPELANAILEARSRFRARLQELGFDEFVEPFDPATYNNQSSIGENLLFGTATEKSFEADNLADNEIVLSVIKESQLEDDLYQMGIEVAHTTVELFGDLDPDNPFFDQLTYMDPDELPEYKTILASISNKSMNEISNKDKKMIMKLPLAYVEEQNRLGLLTDDMKNRLLDARNSLREKLLALPNSPIAFYEPDTYNPAASLQENVLLGRVSASVAEGNERVSLAIRELLNEMNLTDDVFRIGLTFNVGSGGKRLSEIQRQKLHLARALLKQPDILIVNQGLNNLGAREQGEIINMVLEKSRAEGVAPKGVIWAPISPSFSELFDRVIVLNDGEIVADASPEELRNTSSVYQELMA